MSIKYDFVRCYVNFIIPGNFTTRFTIKYLFFIVSLFNMCLFYSDGPRILLQEKKEIWIGLQG